MDDTANQVNTGSAQGDLRQAYEQAPGQRVTAKVEISLPMPEGTTIIDAVDKFKAIKQAVADNGGTITGNIVMGRSKFAL